MVPEPVISPEQRDAAQAWIDKAASKLGLLDRRIAVIVDRPDSIQDAWASTTMSERALATVAISGYLLNETPFDIAHALTHELLHLFHDDVITEVADVTKTFGVNDQVSKMIELVMRRRIERMVDRLANLFMEWEIMPSADEIRAAVGPNPADR